MTVRVKICGLMHAEDVSAAVAAGADAVGFVCVPGTPRYVPPERIVDLARLVPPFVTPVVVVDMTDPLDQGRAEALRFVCSRGVRAVQFHGHEPPWEIGRMRGQFGFSAIKAFKLHAERDLGLLAPYLGAVDAVLLDGGAGEGKRCDWDLAARAVAAAGGLPAILAGGLDPENVAGAIRTVNPWAVDVSSGVERAVGVKDPGRMAAFIEASRRARESSPAKP
ncbi:MAG: phosphoribosylanthranilate isomerase [Candidatus Sericytochromatia bacterium]|nr:phosphoribosylanthranilate isomerase [Candidatus Tanganyikabacteria bacterium]